MSERWSLDAFWRRPMHHNHADGWGSNITAPTATDLEALLRHRPTTEWTDDGIALYDEPRETGRAQ